MPLVPGQMPKSAVRILNVRPCNYGSGVSPTARHRLVEDAVNNHNIQSTVRVEHLHHGQGGNSGFWVLLKAF